MSVQEMNLTVQVRNGTTLEIPEDFWRASKLLTSMLDEEPDTGFVPLPPVSERGLKALLEIYDRPFPDPGYVWYKDHREFRESCRKLWLHFRSDPERLLEAILACDYLDMNGILSHLLGALGGSMTGVFLPRKKSDDYFRDEEEEGVRIEVLLEDPLDPDKLAEEVELEPFYHLEVYRCRLGEPLCLLLSPQLNIRHSLDVRGLVQTHGDFTNVEGEAGNIAFNKDSPEMGLFVKPVRPEWRDIATLSSFAGAVTLWKYDSVLYAGTDHLERFHISVVELRVKKGVSFSNLALGVAHYHEHEASNDRPKVEFLREVKWDEIFQMQEPSREMIDGRIFIRGGPVLLIKHLTRLPLNLFKAWQVPVVWVKNFYHLPQLTRQDVGTGALDRLVVNPSGGVFHRELFSEEASEVTLTQEFLTWERGDQRAWARHVTVAPGAWISSPPFMPWEDKPKDLEEFLTNDHLTIYTAPSLYPRWTTLLVLSSQDQTCLPSTLPDRVTKLLFVNEDRKPILHTVESVTEVYTQLADVHVWTLKKNKLTSVDLLTRERIVGQPKDHVKVTVH